MQDEESKIEKLRKRREQIAMRIDAALQLRKRTRESVRIVAVTKYVGADAVRTLSDIGITDFGENRWQVAKPKVTSLPSATWHFIGPLQRNKVRMIVPHFTWIHSVDRGELADEISREAMTHGVHPKILLQVNVSGEPQKSGVSQDRVLSLLTYCAKLPHVEVAGLMSIGRQVIVPEDARADFQTLAALRNDLERQTGIVLPELSMGMSNDFDIAVEEGATIVRIGRYLVNFEQEL